MTMIDWIAFDADDTLWTNELLYREARSRFAQLMAPYATPDQAGDRLDQIEIGNLGDYGFGIKSFTLSMIEAALALTNAQPEGKVIEQILGLARDMHHAELRVFDQVEETLTQLSERYPLMLVTRGDSFEQERKVRRSGLAGYFRAVEVVGDKSVEIYDRLLTKHGIAPRGFLMVGNSMRADVLPVLALGGIAVHVPYVHTWSYDVAEEPPVDDGRYFELAHLGELPPLLARLEERDAGS